MCGTMQEGLKDIQLFKLEVRKNFFFERAVLHRHRLPREWWDQHPGGVPEPLWWSGVGFEDLKGIFQLPWPCDCIPVFSSGRSVLSLETIFASSTPRSLWKQAIDSDFLQ